MMKIISKPRIIIFTSHAKSKMNFYKLSEQKIKGIIHMPLRCEIGIAPNTIAVMKQFGNGKNKSEIWTMYTDLKNERRIISAWRYPGITKPGEPLPKEIMDQLINI